MKGTEKQIAWATELIEKMHKEFTACKKIAPESFHKNFDAIENIMREAYAGDVIDILSSLKREGYEYFKQVVGSVQISACGTASRIRKEVMGK